MREPTKSIIAANGLTAGYGDLAAVRDVELCVAAGEIVALFGPNGAGKSTTLLTLAGVLPPLGGDVLWEDRPAKASFYRRARAGLAFIPEERSLFMSMSVHDNLVLGRGGVARAVDLFPELGPLLKRKAGLLSGGEQQMTTLARALASGPRALLIDELSLGLAPVIVDRLLEALQRAAAEDGVAVLIVEQQIRRAMAVADRWYLLRQGELAGEGTSASSISELEALYLHGSSS